MRSAPARRSERMMMLMPSRTAASALADSSAMAASMPAAPASAGQVVSSVSDLKWLADLGDRADLFQIGVGQDRLMDFEALGLRRAFEVEQVRPRADDRDEAHHQFLADRVDRRVGHLREVLLEIGEEQLRPIGQRRDRRVVAHGADRFFAGRRHRRHQDFEVFLGVAEHLLAIEQRQVRDRRGFRRRRQVFEHHLRALEPFAVRMALPPIAT